MIFHSLQNHENIKTSSFKDIFNGSSSFFCFLFPPENRTFIENEPNTREKGEGKDTSHLQIEEEQKKNLPTRETNNLALQSKKPTVILQIKRNDKKHEK